MSSPSGVGRGAPAAQRFFSIAYFKSTGLRLLLYSRGFLHRQFGGGSDPHLALTPFGTPLIYLLVRHQERHPEHQVIQQFYRGATVATGHTILAAAGDSR